MSRYPRALTNKQIKFLLNNVHLTNKELAEKLDVTPNTIAVYKTKARKLGYDVPLNVKPKKIEEEMEEIIKEKKNSQ